MFSRYQFPPAFDNANIPALIPSAHGAPRSHVECSMENTVNIHTSDVDFEPMAFESASSFHDPTLVDQPLSLGATCSPLTGTTESMFATEHHSREPSSDCFSPTFANITSSQSTGIFQLTSTPKALANTMATLRINEPGALETGAALGANLQMDLVRCALPPVCPTQEMSISEINALIQQRLGPLVKDGILIDEVGTCPGDTVLSWTALSVASQSAQPLVAEVNHLIQSLTPSTTHKSGKSPRRESQGAITAMFKGNLIEFLNAAPLNKLDRETRKTINERTKQLAYHVFHHFPATCQTDCTKFRMFTVGLEVHRRWRAALMDVCPDLAGKGPNIGQIRRMMYGPKRETQVRINITATPKGHCLELVRNKVAEEIDLCSDERKGDMQGQVQRLTSTALFWLYFLNDDLYRHPDLMDLPLDSKQVKQSAGSKVPERISTKLQPAHLAKMATFLIRTIIDGIDKHFIDKKVGLQEHTNKHVTSTLKLQSSLLQFYQQNKQFGNEAVVNPKRYKAHLEAKVLQYIETNEHNTDFQQQVHRALRGTRVTGHHMQLLQVIYRGSRFPSRLIPVLTGLLTVSEPRNIEDDRPAIPALERWDLPVLPRPPGVGEFTLF